MMRTNNSQLNVRKLVDELPLNFFHLQVIFWGFFIIAMDGLDLIVMAYIGPVIKAQWQIADSHLGYAFSAALVGLSIGAIVAGPVSDRFGRKFILINSVFFFSFWTIVTAFSSDIWHMVLFRFLTGLGLGAAMPNVGTLIAEYAPARRRSLLITVAFCGFTFGSSASGFLAHWLIEDYGWHTLLIVTGIIPLLAVPFLIWKLPESIFYLIARNAPKERIHKLVEQLAPGSSDETTTFVAPKAIEQDKHSLAMIVSDRYRFGTFMLWIGYFMGLFVVYLGGNWLPRILQEANFSSTKYTLVTTIFQFGGIFGSLFCGWAMDRFNRFKALSSIYFTGAICTALVGLSTDHLWLMCIVILGMGFCLFGANSAMNALPNMFYPTEARATGASCMNGVGRIGAIISAFAGSLFVGLSMMNIFLILAVPALITSAALIAMYFSIKDHDPKNLPSPKASPTLQ